MQLWKYLCLLMKVGRSHATEHRCFWRWLAKVDNTWQNV